MTKQSLFFFLFTLTAGCSNIASDGGALSAQGGTNGCDEAGKRGGAFKYVLAFGDSMSGPWRDPAPINGEETTQVEGSTKIHVFGGGGEPLFTQRVAEALGVPLKTFAVAGVTSDALREQLKRAKMNFGIRVGKSYNEPVLVTLTIGGNNLRHNLDAALANDDGGATAQLSEDVDGFLRELFAAFPKAKVSIGNIYDPTDSKGELPQGCLDDGAMLVALGLVVNINNIPDGLKDIAQFLLNVVPAASRGDSKVNDVFGRWNSILETLAKRHAPDAVLVDIRQAFQRHGAAEYGNQSYFTIPDCIHPNANGEQAMTDAFLGAIEGSNWWSPSSTVVETAGGT